MAWKSRSQYEEIRKIGLGAYGKVMLIRKHIGGGLFALKELEEEQIRKSCGTDQNLLQIDLEMTREKADLMTSLQHDHIVRIFGYFKEYVNDKTVYHLIMEYCSGGDLESALYRQKGPFPEADIQRWTRQLALALQFLHDNGVCHRYIKTQNVFLSSASDRKIVKLGDFGIPETFAQMCRICPDQPNVFQYCSPEFVTGDTYDMPSDVWAFGVTVYRMTTFSFPYNVDTVLRYKDAVVNQKPMPISAEYSVELKEFIRSVFRKRPDNRPNMTAILRSVFLSNNLLAAQTSFRSALSTNSFVDGGLTNTNTSASDVPYGSSPSSPITILVGVDENNLQPTELLTAAECGDLPLIETILVKIPRAQLLDTKLWKLAEANGGDTPLHRAAKRDRIDAIQLLLPTFASLLNAENNEHLAAIHKAVLNNSIRVAKFLIDEKPLLLQLKDGKTGRTPLHHACQRGYLELVKILLRYPDTNIYAKSGRDDDENLPVHLAAEYGHVDVVDFLMDRYPDLKVVENSAGNQPLHVAILAGQYAVVKVLVDAGVQIETRGAKFGFGGTPLHLASEKGYLEIVKFLVKIGADIYAKSCSELGQFLAVHLAAFAGHVSIVEYFVEMQPHLVDVKDSHANRLIHLAAIGGHISVVDYLLRKGVPIDIQHEEMMRTPLHIASWKGHLKLASFLIDKGASLQARTSVKDYESMPIHLAAYFGFVDISALFIERNPKLVDAKDCQGNRPIHKAALAGKVDVVDFFLKNGVNIELRQDTFGRTSLHYAAEEGHIKLVEFLVRNGADCHARSNSDDFVQLPIHLAAEFGQEEVVKFFIETVPDLVDAVNSEGERPIHRAAIRGQVRVVDVFLDKGVNIELRDRKFGRTALHYAALAGHVELVEMLMRRGASVYAQSNSHDDRDTPIHLAAWKGHFDVVRYMVEAVHDLANVKDGRGRTPIQWAQLSGNTNEALQIVRWLKGRLIAE